MRKHLLLVFILIQTSTLFSQITYINEAFSGTSLPAGWTNNDIAGNGEVWLFNNPGSESIGTPVSGNFAIFDSDYGGWSSPTEEAALESPAFDATGQNKVILEFDHYFKHYTSDHYYVEIYNGSSWVTVLDGNTDTLNSQSEFIDISAQAAGISNAKVRFRYTGDFDWYWAVDNVFVYAPPNNDDCINATNLTVGTVFNDFPIADSNLLATNSLHISDPSLDPSCGNFGNGKDIWYKLTIPSSGKVAIETRNQMGTSGDDTVISAYSGTCGSLTAISCNDNAGEGPYSRIKLTGRTPGEIIYIRVFEYGNDAIIDFTISAFTCYRNPLRWDGANWIRISNGNIVASPVLDLNRETRIDGDYDTASNGSFSTCTCEVIPGTMLTINSNDYVEIDKDLINIGTVDIRNNGSLVQIQNDATVTGPGVFLMSRNSTTINDNFDYTYWSSPMTSHTLGDMVITTNYYSFDASIQNWVQKNSITNMTPGIGYISRPATGTASGSSFTANFSGAPYNTGTITTSMQFTTVNGTPADDSWNLIGNPYPSAIDANALIDHNPTMNGTLYFWSHVTPLNPSGTSYASSDYATWNRTGSVGTASTSAPTGNGNTNAPTGIIAAGQGFFAQANTTGNIEFTNAMRVTSGNTNFYRTQDNSDRIWLNLTNAQGAFKQQLIGFLPDATDGFDRLYDGYVNNGNGYINFYSIMKNEKFAILANDLIDTEDIIPLGYESTIASTFSIAIDHLSGAMDTDEFDVFIKDLDLNIIHNLKESPYQFDTTIGTFDNRFELFVQRSSALAVDNTVENEDALIINQDNQGVFTLQTNNGDIISEVIAYNTLGQLIASYSGENTQVQLDLKQIKKGNLLIFKVNTASKKQFTKKILKIN